MRVSAIHDVCYFCNTGTSTLLFWVHNNNIIDNKYVTIAVYISGSSRKINTINKMLFHPSYQDLGVE